MSRYKRLIVWQKSIDLVKDIYNIAEYFPKNEIFGLTSQIKRSVISIPSNIAEGKGRKSKKEFINFLHISLGSLYELQTQIFIASELKLINDNDLKRLNMKMDEIEKMINSLIAYTKTN